MIENFKHKGLKRLYEKDDQSKLPSKMVERIKQILFVLDTATRIDQIDIVGFRLHPLKGNRKGFYAVDVQANWRITFRFEDGSAFDVNFEDYHS